MMIMDCLFPQLTVDKIFQESIGKEHKILWFIIYMISHSLGWNNSSQRTSKIWTNWWNRKQNLYFFYD